MAQSLFPPVYRAADFPDWGGESPPATAVLPMRGALGKWWVIGVFNWADRPADRTLDLRELTGERREPFVFSFWDERIMKTEDGRLRLEKIPAHGSVLLAVRPRGSGIQYVGSNLHFTQGAEVAEWKDIPRIAARGIAVWDARPKARIWLSLPGRSGQHRWNGAPVQAEQAGESVWKIPVRFSGKGILDVRWKQQTR